MAEASWPSPTYNSRAVNDAEYERLVASQAADGLIGVPSDTPLIYADGTGTREVRVVAERYALVRGRMWYSGSTIVTLPALSANSSGSTRIDLVVLRLDRSTFEVTVEVVEGTPGASAPAATRQTGGTGVWEMELAEVTVADGATTLAGSTVTPRAWYLGDDGQILCTSTTRPPHQLGRRIGQTDGRDYISTGSSWVLTREDTGVVDISPASGWSTSLCRYQRVNRFVTLEVSVGRTGGNLGAGTDTTTCTLPSGARPRADMRPDGVIWLPSSAPIPCIFTLSAAAGTLRMTDYRSTCVTGSAVHLFTLTYPVG
jgi:hypothetical protein